MTDAEWKNKVTADIDSIKMRLQSLEVQSAVDEVHRINVEIRLSSIEDTLKWLVRLIIGALIMAAIAFALGGGFVLP